MYYGEFSKSLANKSTGVDIVESFHYFGNLIQKTAQDKVLINNIVTEFKTIEEARTYIKTKQHSEDLEETVTKEIYEEITANRIANIIKEYHDVKVTDTLIESYLDLASSKIFTIDPVVQDIRKLNKLDIVVEKKLHYQLSDGSVVAINEATQSLLNNLLQNQKEIIEYMREDKENFLHVLERIEEQ
jgi:hypothetical protein